MRSLNKLVRFATDSSRYDHATDMRTKTFTKLFSSGHEADAPRSGGLSHRMKGPFGGEVSFSGGN